MLSTLKTTVTLAATVALFSGGTAHADSEYKTVEIAYNGGSLFYDAIDPATTKGAHFIYEGIIYPAGTLSNCSQFGDTCGWLVNAAGELEPEFPDQVIGTFTCSGWVLSTEGWDAFFAALVSGDLAGVQTMLEQLRGQPAVRVTQTHDFHYDETAGTHMVITDGYELFSLPGDSVARPVIGGSGVFRNTKGQSELTEVLRINASGGPTVSVTFPFPVWH